MLKDSVARSAPGKQILPPHQMDVGLESTPGVCLSYAMNTYHVVEDTLDKPKLLSESALVRDPLLAVQCKRIFCRKESS